MYMIGLFALVIACAAFVAPRYFGSAASEAQDRDGRGEKVSSGISYEKLTRIERRPRASIAAVGYDSERVWSGYDDWEPAVATQPNSTVVYMATTRYSGPKACNGCPFPIIIVRKSTDGGATWGPDRNIPITKFKQNDPEIAVATDGTLYLAWMDNYKPGIKFAKSSDGGATWTTPVSLTPAKGTPNWGDKPLLAISPSGLDVYIAFNASDNYVATSHNHGTSFTVSPKLNSDTRYWFDTAGAVAPNGSVYFMTADFSQDYTGVAHVGVLKSGNGGASWTNTVVDTSQQMPGCAWSAGCTLGFFGTMGGLAIDTAGTVMIGYNANNTASAPMQLYVRTSTNGGTSWSARQDLGAGLAVEHHSIAVAAGTVPNDFGVAWEDDRNGANTYFNAWLRRTTNGGSTWTAPVRLSDQATGAPYKSVNGHSFPYGDYLEMATDSADHYHVAWGEGTSFTGPGGTWYTKSN